MNICRILVRASGSHHLWKRAYTTVGSPAPMTANKMFDDIKNLTAGSYLDLISRDQRNKGYYLSEANLIGCANLLCNDGKDEIALEIYEWMEKRKMTFSPSEFAQFVDLMGKIRGHVAANDLFKRVEPNFEKMNPGDLKNWPANRKLLESMKQKSMENFCARLQFHTMMLEKASLVTLAYPKENLENSRPIPFEFPYHEYLEDDDLKTRTLEHMESEENLENDGPIPFEFQYDDEYSEDDGPKTMTLEQHIEYEENLEEDGPMTTLEHSDLEEEEAKLEEARPRTLEWRGRHGNTP